MLRQIELISLVFFYLAFVSCQKEKNSATPAYDTIPNIVNTADKFLYSFNIGYLNIDTLIPLEYDHDTMNIHLKITDFKSGYAGCYLRGNGVNILSFSALSANKDTSIQVINADTARKWRFLSHKFTGNFVFEISPTAPTH